MCNMNIALEVKHNKMPLSFDSARRIADSGKCPTVDFSTENDSFMRAGASVN